MEDPNKIEEGKIEGQLATLEQELKPAPASIWKIIEDNSGLVVLAGIGILALLAIVAFG